MQKSRLQFPTILFVVTTYVISWAEQARTIQNGHGQNSLDGLFLMWTPGIIAIICSVIFYRNVKVLAFKKPSLKSLGIAYLVPALIAVATALLLIVFKISELEISPAAIEKLGSAQAVLVKGLIVAPTVGMIIPFVSGLGEEIGWRGFLHSQFSNLTATSRYLTTGIIWSIWHWPLILFGTYSTSDKPWLSVLLFTTMATSASFLFGYLRDRSKSVFPAALLHASHNMWLLGISPGFLKAGPLAPYFAGEAGVFCAFLYVLSAAVVIFKCRESDGQIANG
jgi:membrane protease YdiL (CAAX protease family)